MSWAELIKAALSVQGIKNFLTVYDENDNLSKDQIIGSVIQFLLFGATAILIWFLFL